MNEESRLLANVSIHPEVPAPGHIKFSLDSRGNAELVPEVHIALHATHAALPKLTLKFPPKRQHSQSYHSFTMQQPFKHKIRNSHQMLNLLHVHHNEIIHLPSPFRSQCSILPPTLFSFSKRTSKHCSCNERALYHCITSSHQTNHFSLQKFKIRHTDTSLSYAHLETQ